MPAPPSPVTMGLVSLPETVIAREELNQELAQVVLASAVCVSLHFEFRLVK